MEKICNFNNDPVVPPDFQSPKITFTDEDIIIISTEQNLSKIESEMKYLAELSIEKYYVKD